MKRATASTEWIALALIMLLGAVLRLGWPRIAEFKADEAHIAELALDLAHGHSLPLQGIMTSVGLPKPPISIYLYAIPFALSSNPIVANLFTALLNVGAVALCWWLGRRYWGRAAGLAAGRSPVGRSRAGPRSADAKGRVPDRSLSRFIDPQFCNRERTQVRAAMKSASDVPGAGRVRTPSAEG